MRVRVASFNLNNLFSRFNFQAEVDEMPGAVEGGGVAAAVEVVTTFHVEDPSSVKHRTYQGRLVKGKPAAERKRLAERIAAVDAEVLGVQEAEDVDTLQGFAAQELADLGYRHVVLVEGNDPRLIDLGVLSRLPIGGVTSWRHSVHPARPDKPVFSRDLLEVEILNERRTKTLFTLYNNHLKSHFVPHDEDPVAGAAEANARRQEQAERAAAIITARTRPRTRFAVVGDMNDPPESEFLAPLVAGPLRLADGLAEAQEDGPAPKDNPPAPSRPWSHRFKESRRAARYELFDHIWLSPALAGLQQGAGINRRRKLNKDGSDHDPVWVDLQL
jgi:endonuclease/exonuclease/phosphatase family metal-dependent hydrolase